MKIRTFKFIALLISGTLIFANCKKDKNPPKLPPPAVESPELITTLLLQFTDSSDVSKIFTAAFRDPDGAGGNPPTKFDTIKLSANKSYFVDILVLDESKNPADTVSIEIEEEKDEHQFFFTHNNVNIITTYLDMDSNALPLGLKTKWKTATAGNGTTRVKLKHQVGNKDGTETPGETDVEVIFQTLVE